MSLEQIEQFLKDLSSLGPLPGILVPLLEAFLPFLPLIVIIAANVNIYGFGFGILFSWIGIVVGATAIFGLCRKYGHRLRDRLQKRYATVEKIFGWIESRGFTPLFLLSCFPFTPSVLITLVSALSKLPFRSFLVAVALGKAVMVLFIALLSFDITNLFSEPWRIVASVAGIAILWLGGKKLEQRYNK
ncbi:putative membrane protein YhjE [Paenibacillus montaniterrae]|uniref:TVP38/TMEM64 family membrane protein n=1 Tax=Paenibacillus montaniterrae TaxID=429341 RepID=A0A919YTP3_9BACL|nr:TVP38/TMEM64 family protein [Paenibacillus montaniterrae]GIP17959.1 putative membrane protein YhjE [Paenibacillus montaniterrae]